MKLFLVPGLPNINAERVRDAVAEVCRVLAESGADICIDGTKSDFFDLKGVKYTYLPDETFDTVIAVGGDGTILGAARVAVELDRPLLGINAGRLGFLSGLETDELSRLRCLIDGGYTVKERMMISAELELPDGERRIIGASALNEVLLSRADASKTVEFEVRCENKTVCIYRGDGLIFATPTGSTAYSMSAGGPVTDPDMNAMIMTPVCPHELFARPMVFAPDKVFSVCARRTNHSSSLSVAVDGTPVGALELGSKLIIRRSEKKLKLIDLDGREFYEVFGDKFVGSI